MSELQAKIEEIIYPNEQGLVWTREEQVNLLLALFEKHMDEEIRVDLQKMIDRILSQQKKRDLSYITGRRWIW
jgi:hypothetical protein